MHGQRRNRPAGGAQSGEIRGAAGRERAIAELGRRQRGVVTRTQLRDIGLSPDAIDYRLRSGRLHALHRGVYLLGYSAPAPGARELGAVLACGAGAVISHRSAGALWKLLPRLPGGLEITVAGRDPGRKPGIRIHCVSSLDRRDVRKLHGIPITTPGRTLLDLAATASSRELEQAVAEAHARRLVHRTDLVSLLARYPARRGTRALRGLIEAEARPALTRSQAEERFLALVRSAELPPPEVNVRIGAHEVDFLWRDHGLVVEIDGFAFHSSRPAFERDRVRDGELAALGFRVIRVTWRQIVDKSEAVAARVAGALAATPASPRGRGAAP